MTDITLHVITPATTVAFLTLDEAKLLLGIALTDTTEDALVQMLIDNSSATIMRVCNRVFAKETLSESWRDLGGRRLFLTHWPVNAADITSVVANGTTLDPATDYELEELSGKVSNFNGWDEPVVVTYTGGYLLPDDAPLPLKQATLILVREEKINVMRSSMQGVRSISHKDSRVMFFDITKPPAQTGIHLGTGSPTVDALLTHYMRFWI